MKQLAAWLCLLLAAPLAAEQGEYQLGAGILLTSQPHYLGAAQAKNLVLPVPFFSYKSERLTIDRQGATGFLADGDGWQLNVSLAGALPVDSKDNLLRQGMPSLDWVGEIGPALDVGLSDSWTLRLPLRQAIAGDLRHQQAIGQRFEPELRYNRSLNEELQWQMTTSLAWNSRQYHQYFYGVSAEYSTDDRSAYQAKAGFSGFRFSNGLIYQRENWWLGIYARYDYLGEAVYADSPLFGRKHQFSSGLVLVRIFQQSHN